MSARETTLFVASSVEGLEVAREVQSERRSMTEPVILTRVHIHRTARYCVRQRHIPIQCLIVAHTVILNHA
jgi:hypothetical protein